MGILHWLAVHLGFDKSAGPSQWYSFWSGFGSDLGEVTLLGAVFGLYRGANCHEKGCWRFGHPVEDSHVRACHRHHPTHPRTQRSGSVAEMHDQYRASKSH